MRKTQNIAKKISEKLEIFFCSETSKNEVFGARRRRNFLVPDEYFKNPPLFVPDL